MHCPSERLTKVNISISPCQKKKNKNVYLQDFCHKYVNLSFLPSVLQYNDAFDKAICLLSRNFNNTLMAKLEKKRMALVNNNQSYKCRLPQFRIL